MACWVKVDVKRPLIMMRAPNEARNLGKRHQIPAHVYPDMPQPLSSPLETKQQPHTTQATSRRLLKNHQVNKRAVLSRQKPHPLQLAQALDNGHQEGYLGE